MKNEIKVSRIANYYTINEDIKTNQVLYVIHGYAQLASEFIKEFDYLKNSKTLIVAPEGLSKFYGRDRTPVASWMTSHERENEINDHVNYLNKLHTKIKKEFTINKVTILGFSQGCSTALRWINKSNLNSIKLHLCSGSIPPELHSENNLNQKINQTYFYYGNQDRLMKQNQADQAISALQELRIEWNLVLFEGKHEVSQETHKLLRNSI
jgi:predicted esterase